MEAERENTESMVLFLKLFNDVLWEITGDQNYKFNPHGIMCDESGANFQAITEVFGKRISRLHCLLSMAFLTMCKASCEGH